jgi:peptidoglycan hydrolase-like protein with peptidoglycan-binding domain
MHKLAIIALAAAMGLAWSTMPAVAADSDKTVKDKAVDAKDTVKEKTSEAWDKTKEKTSEAWDKTKEKTTEAKDKVDRGIDKTRAKTREAKDKVAGKMERSDDIRQAQTALKDKGHDPGPIDGIHGPRTSAALRSYQKAENIKVTGRLDSGTRSHLMGQASATPSTATPAASPSTVNQPVPPPASVGSPSNPPMPAEKAQTK